MQHRHTITIAPVLPDRVLPGEDVTDAHGKVLYFGTREEAARAAARMPEHHTFVFRVHAECPCDTCTTLIRRIRDNPRPV